MRFYALRIAIAFLIACGLAGWSDAQSPSQTPKKSEVAEAKWDKEITAIEAKSAKLRPEQRRWIFTGSSSIRLWNLSQAFPDMPYANHGFGGSQMSDVVENFDRLIGKWKPEGVVIYSGDNDLAAEKSPERIAADLNAIMDRLAVACPDAMLVVIGPKASVKRWAINDRRLKTVELERAAVAARMNPRYAFMDDSAMFLDGEGNPKPELFQADGLHLSPAGYKIWNERLAALLKSIRE